MTAFREEDMFPILRQWLEGNGYEVHAEVGSCDLAARKGEELALIEMKLAINLELLLQIVRRQRAHASVYAAVPPPKNRDRRWRERTRLLKRLEAGLLIVHLDSALPRVELAFHPVEQKRRRHADETRALLREMSGRSLNLNVGGRNRRQLMTAYRESALMVAVCLEKTGPASPRGIRLAGGPDTTPQVLRGNPYDWFERLGKACYALTSAGREALANPEYAELLAILRQRRDAEK